MPLLQVADPVVVVLAEELGEPEVVGGVQAAGEGAVVERVEARGGVGAQLLGVGDLPAAEGAPAFERGRDGGEARHAERLGGRAGAHRPLADVDEVAVVERVGGELDLEVGGRERALAAELVQRAEQPRVGGGVAAEQVLAHRAAGDEPRADRGELGADQLQPVVEGVERQFEAAGGGQRLREADEQLEPARQRLGRLREQPERRGEAVRGGRGSAGRGVAAGLDQDRDGLAVAGLGAALEVVGARGERAAAGFEGGCRAAVCGDPPAVGGGLVDREPDQRVAEAVAARGVGGGEEGAGDELVERGQRLVLGEAGGGDREVEIDGVARHGGALREHAGVGAQRGDLLFERARDGLRDAGAGGLRGDGPARGVLARELLQEERVAAAGLVDLAAHGGGDGGAEQGLGVREAQRAERVLDHGAVAFGGGERGGEQRSHRRGPERERQRHPAARRSSQQVRGELERGVVGPLEVVEDDHDRPLERERVEQHANRPVRAVALVLETRRAADLREHRGELGQLVADEPLQPVHAEERGVVGERVLPDAERHLALQLGCAAAEDQELARHRSRGQLVEQPRLADPAFAAERDHRVLAVIEPLQCFIQRRQLGPPPEECSGHETQSIPREASGSGPRAHTSHHLLSTTSLKARKRDE